MKYKLYIRQYDIATNNYKVREEEVETNDIYHTIGKIYCTAICEIKRIDYQKIDKEKELQQKIDKAIEVLKEIEGCDAYIKEVLQILGDKE